MGNPLQKLGFRHRVFIHHYVFGEAKGNGAKAAEIAGFKAKNLSARACQLLKEPLIIKEIETKRKELLDRFDYTEEEIKGFLGEIIEGDERTSDKLTAIQTVAKIKGFLKENTTNVNVDIDSNVDKARNAIDNKYIERIA